MKLLTATSFILLLALGACSSVTKDALKSRGANAADQLLIDSAWAVCELASIGSVNRKYGQTTARADTYKAFCKGDGKANVISPPKTL